jgi:SPP1 gp7 family putative phage head morphogenesis protein
MANVILAAMIIRRGRLPKRLVRQQQPDLIRGKYAVDIRHAIAPMKRVLQAHLWPLMPRLLESARAELSRQDAGESARARAAVEAARGAFSENFRSMAGTAREAALATSDFQKRQLSAQLRSAVAVEVPLRDPKLGPKLESFTEENVRLIKSIPARYFDEVEKLVLDAVADGRRWESLADDIDERFDVGESRANLIARDQVGKFYGALNEARQTSLGVKSYVWRTMRDQRVREEHSDREGEVFQWSAPPDDGHPGEPVNCRCWAEPNLEELLEDLEAA